MEIKVIKIKEGDIGEAKNVEDISLLDVLKKVLNEEEKQVKEFFGKEIKTLSAWDVSEAIRKSAVESLSEMTAAEGSKFSEAMKYLEFVAGVSAKSVNRLFDNFLEEGKENKNE